MTMTLHRALVLNSFDTPFTLETVTRPSPGTGEVLVRVLAVYILDYAGDVFCGKRPFPLSFPLVPGQGGVGRVEQVGDDAVSLLPGQLVLIGPTVRARDDPDISILLGFHGGFIPAARKLMDGPWRNGTFAEYVKLPIEHVFPLDEDKLLKELDYTIADLCWIPACLVPYAGLMDAGVKQGDSVIIAPATGRFGGASVTAALAMGATVIAAGRNAAKLDRLSAVFGRTGRFKTVTLSSNLKTDSETLKAATPRAKGADFFLDFSPPSAGNSTHIKACIQALRNGGGCILMGGVQDYVEIPYAYMVFNNLHLHGRLMYEPSHAFQMIKLIETGNMKLGKEAGIHLVGTYGLDKIYDALSAAAQAPGWGSQVILKP